MSSKKISVYITSYNQRDYLIEAIESVLNQTLKPYEVIIVDDCSTDGSQEVIATYAQRYPSLIFPFYHKQNIGIPRNRNFALKQVKGDFVTFLDGDDRFLPNKLESELKALSEQPNSKIAYSNFFFINESGERQSLWAEPGDQVPSSHIFIETFCHLFPKGFPFRSEMIHMPSLKTVGFYDEHFSIWEDWDLRIRLTNCFTSTYCPLPLSEYRANPQGASKTRPSQHINIMMQIYNKNLHLLSKLNLKNRIFIKKIILSRIANTYYHSIIRESVKKSTAIPVRMLFTLCFYCLLNFDLKLAAKIILPKRILLSMVNEMVLKDEKNMP